MKTRILLTISFILTMNFIVSAQPNELLSLAQETILDATGLEKLNNIRNKSYHKSAQLVRIGSISALQKRGAIPFSIPGRNGKIVAHTDSIEFLSDDHYTWHGSFKKEPGYVTLMAREGRIFGHLRIEGNSYEIQSMDKGLSILIELDEDELSTFTCGASDESIGSTTQSNNHTESENSSNQRMTSVSFTNVRVLVLFTTAASNAVGNINDVATLAIQQLNDAKYNSNINTADLNFTHAGTQFLNFTERVNGDIESDVDDLANYPTAQNLRNTYDADLVVLLTDGPYGNVAGIVQEIGPSNAGAYSIVQVDFATSSYTFAHELGHLMGARHQQCFEYDPCGGVQPPFCYSPCDDTAGDPHGRNFTYKTGIWPFRTDHRKHTVMHNLRYGYNRIPHFSNPDVDYGPKDIATGELNVQNNARILRINAPTVEDFREFVSPYNVNISGVTSAYGGQSLSFSANGTGGTLPYSYQWWVSTDGFGYVYAGTGSSLYYAMPASSNLYLRVNSSDSGGDSDVDYHTVTNTGSQCIKNCPPELDPNLRIAEVEEGDSQELNISIYPNPTKDYLNIALNRDKEGKATIYVSDVQGKTSLKLNEHKLIGGLNLLEVNLSELEAGIYFLNLVIDDEHKTLRVIKND